MKIFYIENINQNGDITSNISRDPKVWQSQTCYKLEDIGLEVTQEGNINVYGLYPKFFMGKPYAVGRELVGVGLNMPMSQVKTTPLDEFKF